MKTARIVGPQRFEILEVEPPKPQPGEVLVRMQHLSICGSDLLTYERVLPEEEYPGPAGYPCHECFGVIEESYADGLKPGQKVISLAYSGGLVEYSAAPAHLVVPVDDSIPDEQWVLCQPAGTVIFALQRAGSVFGKTVAVLGQGPIGLIFTDLLVRGGASRVIVSDVIEHRLELAHSLGATDLVNAAKLNVPEAVLEATGGEGADIVIDAAGTLETTGDIFPSLKKQGTAVVFGMPHMFEPIPFDWFNMYNKLPTILVVNSRRSNDVVPSVRASVDLVKRGGLDLSYLVTHRFPFDKVEDAFRLFAGRTDNVVKVLIDV